MVYGGKKKTQSGRSGRLEGKRKRKGGVRVEKTIVCFGFGCGGEFGRREHGELKKRTWLGEREATNGRVV
jgi:hypothetical protein